MSIASFITVLRLFLTCIDLIISINFIWLYRYTATLGVCSESYGSTCCWCYSECVKHGVLVWIGKPRGLWYIEGSCWSADTILGLWTGTLQCEISLFFVICTFDSDFDVYRVVFSEHLLVLSGCKCYTVHPVFYRLYAFVHHTVDMAIFCLSVCLSVCYTPLTRGHATCENLDDLIWPEGEERTTSLSIIMVVSCTSPSATVFWNNI